MSKKKYKYPNEMLREGQVWEDDDHKGRGLWKVTKIVGYAIWLSHMNPDGSWCEPFQSAWILDDPIMTDRAKLVSGPDQSENCL